MILWLVLQLCMDAFQISFSKIQLKIRNLKYRRQDSSCNMTEILNVEEIKILLFLKTRIGNNLVSSMKINLIPNRCQISNHSKMGLIIAKEIIPIKDKDVLFMIKKINFRNQASREFHTLELITYLQRLKQLISTRIDIKQFMLIKLI